MLIIPKLQYDFLIEHKTDPSPQMANCWYTNLDKKDSPNLHMLNVEFVYQGDQVTWNETTKDEILEMK